MCESNLFLFSFSFSYSLTHTFIHSFLYRFTHSLTHSLTHSPAHCSLSNYQDIPYPHSTPLHKQHTGTKPHPLSTSAPSGYATYSPCTPIKFNLQLEPSPKSMSLVFFLYSLTYSLAHSLTHSLTHLSLSLSLPPSLLLPL